MKKAFNNAADVSIKALGSPYALPIAVLVIVVWAVTGRYLDSPTPGSRS
jgi:low affinity Fe/Cu permease